MGIFCEMVATDSNEAISAWNEKIDLLSSVVATLFLSTLPTLYSWVDSSLLLLLPLSVLVLDLMTALYVCGCGSGG